MALMDLIEQAEDLGSYDATGILWIFRRPANQIDLSLTYLPECDQFRAEVRDENLYYAALKPTRLRAVEAAMDGYLAARVHGIGSEGFKEQLARVGRAAMAGR